MHNIELKNVFEKVTSSQSGLSVEESEKRLQENGKNVIEEGKKKNKFIKYLEQFKDILIIVLILSSLLSIFIAIFEHDPGGFLDAGVIMAVVLINATIGFIQENKAEAAMEALKNVTKPYAKVIRDGKIIKVKTEELVVGDVVIIEAGDIVPADLRLFETASLQIIESALTGESVPVEKNIEVVEGDNIPLGDRTNITYLGSTVSYGRGKGVVISTGMKTEMGKIAGRLNTQEKTTTPLTARIQKTNKFITIATVIIAVLIFASGFARGVHFAESIMITIAIAVCVIPEGLPASMTITMALGVQRMGKRQAIVRNLPAVETLGSTEIICSDKTGTLTLNKMTVNTIFTNDSNCMVISGNACFSDDETEEIDIPLYPDETAEIIIDSSKLNSQIDLKLHKDRLVNEQITNSVNFIKLMKCMLLCNDTQIKFDGETLTTVGDPTETALVHYGYSYGFSKDFFEGKFVRINEIPFDSSRKLMTTINKGVDGCYAYTKGAVASVISRCTRILENGKVRKITEKDFENINKATSNFARQALRVLAYAYRNIEEPKGKIKSEDVENNLIFIGLSGMIDPPREEVWSSINICKEAGILPIMITGDHRETAFAIAKTLGIAESENEVLTGAQINEMTDTEFAEEILKYRVFARVNPEHKVKIVEAFKAMDKVVAMTGDGVNDAPSIKSADIGIGMGITGTDITKGVSDIILTDDNFATIVGAVEEGRRVYGNIMRIIIFLLGTSLAELVLLTTIIGVLRMEFWGPLLILWINIVSDSLPALALGVEQAERDVMKAKPNNSRGNLFKGKVGMDIIVYSLIQVAMIFTLFFTTRYALGYEPVVVTTMCFLALVCIELVQAINLRSRENSIFSFNPFSNKYLIGAILVSFILTIIIVLIPIPALQNTFGITTLTWGQWLVSVGVGVLMIPFVEIYKLVCRIVMKKRASTN